MQLLFRFLTPHTHLQDFSDAGSPRREKRRMGRQAEELLADKEEIITELKRTHAAQITSLKSRCRELEDQQQTMSSEFQNHLLIIDKELRSREVHFTHQIKSLESQLAAAKRQVNLANYRKCKHCIHNCPQNIVV